MILVQKIINSLLDENTYIVYNNENKQALIIDPGSDFDKIIGFVNENGLLIQGILLTHGHFDHTLSCKDLQGIGYKIYVHILDENMCINERSSLAYTCDKDFKIFIPNVVLNNEQEITMGSFVVKLLHVPGHSQGSLAFVIDNMLFSGDTLFFNGYGRTDLEGGDKKQIISSVKILLSYLKKGYKLYPGHDY